MTAYTMSVVQLCPGAHKIAAEQVAEAAGYGAGNLSVELRDASNNVWWGCHAWWVPSALAAASALPPEAPAAWHAAMAAVITRTQYGGEPLDNWQAALAENGLGVVEVPE
jgi:hypothetical protein